MHGMYPFPAWTRHQPLVLCRIPPVSTLTRKFQIVPRGIILIQFRGPAPQTSFEEGRVVGSGGDGEDGRVVGEGDSSFGFGFLEAEDSWWDWMDSWDRSVRLPKEAAYLWKKQLEVNVVRFVSKLCK